MQQLSKNTNKLSLQELQNHPQLLSNLIAQEKDSRFIIETHGDEVVVVQQKKTSLRFVEIMQKVEAERNKRKKQGYTREQLFQEFFELQDELNLAITQ